MTSRLPIALALIALIACGVAERPAPLPSLRAIQEGRDVCKEARTESWPGAQTPYLPGPRELTDCDWSAIQATGALTSRSSGTPHFLMMLVDLADRLELTMSGGEEALALRVVATYWATDFAVRRVAILTDQPSPLPSSPSRPEAASGGGNPFEGLHAIPDLGVDAAHLLRRWTDIRDADCAAYPVSDCAARLDDALNHMLRDELSTEVGPPQ